MTTLKALSFRLRALPRRDAGNALLIVTLVLVVGALIVLFFVARPKASPRPPTQAAEQPPIASPSAAPPISAATPPLSQPTHSGDQSTSVSTPSDNSASAPPGTKGSASALPSGGDGRGPDKAGGERGSGLESGSSNRRSTSEPASGDDIAGTAISIPALELPTLSPSIPAVEGGERARAMNALCGEWDQVGGNKQADFAEGGYIQGRLHFGKDGILRIFRVYGTNRDIQVTRQVAWTVSGTDQVSLAKSNELNQDLTANRLVIKTGLSEDIAILPPTVTLPASFTAKCSGDRLELSGKTYVRVPGKAQGR